MSPGRASSAETILRPLLPCSALRTHVETAAQPPQGILCPACSSDQVTNDAHHGFPGETPAAARYWSTCGPVFVLPISRTPRWVSATCSAAAPSELPLPPSEPTAAASVTAPAPGVPADAATATGWAGGASGATGLGRTACRKACEPPLLPASPAP